MKKALVSTILGIVTTVSVLAQGHVNVSNYLTAPYNPVVWGAGSAQAGQRMLNNTTVQLQLWYGAGVLTDASALVLGETFTINPGLTFEGGGYYNAITQVVPTVGTYTFQLRAIGTTPWGNVDTVASRSALWQPTGIGSTALPAATDNHSIGLVVVVPEPSTFALFGLGSAALMLFRRRN